jgi:hypothetical protein
MTRTRTQFGATKPTVLLWHEIFKPFGSVKTLRVGGQLVGQLSRALQPGEGGLPTELLPKLQELSYPSIPFVDARQKAGRWSTLEKRVLQWNYWGGVRGEVFHRCLDYNSHSC